MSNVTTLAALAEQVALRLGGGRMTDDFGYREADRILLIRQSCAAVAEKHMASRSLKPGVSPVDGHYIYSHTNVPVKEYSEKGDLCLADLPDIPLAVMGSRGIQGVYVNNDLRTQVYPIPAGSSGMIGSLRPKTPTYEHIGSQLRIRLAGSQITSVTIDMLTVAPAALDPDAFFAFPLNLQAAAVEMAIGMIRGGSPQDVDNDSNDNK